MKTRKIETKRVVIRFDNTVSLYYNCPNCNTVVHNDSDIDRYKHCPHCGTLLEFPIGPTKRKILMSYIQKGHERGGIL